MAIKIPIGTQKVRGPSGGLISPQTSSTNFGSLEAKAGVFDIQAREKNVQQVAQLGQQVLSFAAELKHRGDVTLAKSAYNSASDEMREAMNSMYTTTDAKGVSELPTTADAAIQGIFEKYAKNLTPEQSRILKPMWDQKRASALDSIYDYSRGQMLRIEKEQNSLIIKDAIQDASFNYKDPSQVQHGKDKIMSVIKSEVMQGNLSPEQAEARTRNVMTTLHNSILQTALAERNIGFANNYFKEVKKELDSSVRIKVQDQLSRVENTEVAKAIADNIMENFETEEAAAEHVQRKYKDDLLRGDIEKEVEARHVDKRRFEQQENRRHFEVGFAAISDAQSYEETIGPVNEFKGTPEDRVGLDRYAKTKFKTELENVNKEVKRRNELIKTSRRLDMEQRIGAFDNAHEVQRHAMKIGLDDTEMTEVVQLWKDGGVSKNITLGKIGSAANSLGIELSANDVRTLFNLVKRDFENTDKAITKNQLDETVLNYFVEGDVRQSWKFWDPDKTYFDAFKAGQADDWLPDLTDAEMIEMRQQVKLQNLRSKAVPGQLKYIDPDAEEKLRAYYLSNVMGMPNEREMNARRDNAIRVFQELNETLVKDLSPATIKPLSIEGDFTDASN